MDGGNFKKNYIFPGFDQHLGVNQCLGENAGRPLFMHYFKKFNGLFAIFPNFLKKRCENAKKTEKPNLSI